MTQCDQRGLQARNGHFRSRRVQVNLVGRSARDSDNVSRKTVLVVDDEPSILTVRRLVFEAQGYSVLTAEGGHEALSLLQENLVDAVILDYLMPEMDGEETARKMRELDGDLPIILSTGCASVPPQVMETVTLMVHKGSGPQILIDAVERQLEMTPKSQLVSDAAIQTQS